MSKYEGLPYIVAVDFDGTLCDDNFPKIGKPHFNVIDKIKEYKSFGWKVILWTCRNGKDLDKAVQWCDEQGLKFDAVNENLPEVEELFGGWTRKIFADVYIDDKNVLIKEVDRSGIRVINTKQHH